jgi:2-iminobutanoate/2-iminopropanoate deaminase
MCSVISGVDPGTRNLPSDLAGQKPATGRAALNGEWVKIFPDEGSRPARHTLALGADGNALVT